MADVFDSYLGAKDEATFGTAIAVDKFYEFTSESITPAYERIESEALRAGAKFLRSDRWVPNAKGAAGEIEMEVTGRQFGFWFKHCLGGVSSGVATSGVTPHTFTPGALNGKSFTVQVGRPGSNGAVHPFTYSGGKVTEWTLSNDVDGLLTMSVAADFQKETTSGSGAFAVQTPSYPATDNSLFAYTGGVVSIGGTAVKVNSISITGSTGVKTDRYFIGANGNNKREQLENEVREVSFEMELEFEDLTQYNRFNSSTAAGALAAVNANWTALAVAGGGIPKVDVTLANARFDGGAVNIGGRELLTQTLSGKALYDGSAQPITVVYTTPDATV